MPTPYKDFWGIKNLHTGTIAGVTQEQFHECLAKRGPNGDPLFEDYTTRLVEENRKVAQAALIETAKAEEEAAQDEPAPEVVRVRAEEALDAPEATDAATALAAENGLELAFVKGTGSGGKITKADVQRALS